MKPTIPENQPQIFDRSIIIRLLQTANNIKASRFAKNLAHEWLSNFPGDLAVEYLLAAALVKLDHHEEALPLLKKIANADPEYLPTHRLLAYSGYTFPYGTVQTAHESIYALGGQQTSDKDLLWGDYLRQAQEKNKAGQHQDAEKFFFKALAENPNTPLAAVLHLKFAYGQYPWKTLQDLSKNYYNRWPDTLACILLYADTLNKGGKEEEAVNLLHQAATLDIGGQVAIRLWGSNHPYQQLFPHSPQMDLQIPIPADIASAVGWNQLMQGELAKSNKAPNPSMAGGHPGKRKKISKKVVASTQQEFNYIAAKVKKPKLASADGRYPVYLIASCKQGLEAQYGTENLKNIDDSLAMLAKQTKQINGWNARVVYVDDPLSADQFGLPPALPKDPWSIKKFFVDMDTALGKHGERIGALLLVGGDSIVPFHMLPNPVDDFDTQVPSDNPYACRDENYFVPTWPVGRVPGSVRSNPIDLIKQIQHIVDARSAQLQTQTKSSFLSHLIQKIRRRLFGTRIHATFGYSAEVWRRAAHAVYRQIGKPHLLNISPPTESKNLPATRKKGIHAAYYNLHGLEDAAEWYGHKDPVESTSGPEYPVALKPENIKNSGRAPTIIFSEACFGANILNKNVDQAISLKFLDSGTLAMVGATCTSYGSLSTPLIAADLLGKMFWIFLKEGFPAGEALRRAKIHLAKEMNKRQGYLDGEDQKTLISFVLYGDPLAQIPSPDHQPGQKGYMREYVNPNKIKTVCDKTMDTEKEPIPPEVIQQVKGVVKKYLPGMENAKIALSHEHLHCVGHHCPTSDLGEQAMPKNLPTRKVVTLSKQFVKGDHTHAYHARITINTEGKITKLAVSR